MMKIKMYQVDAFTDRLFSGNPAAVCILDEWISNELMQSIADENNLAETSFVVPKGPDFEIRWFTPAVEVDLCGHATLASAFVLQPDLKEISELDSRGLIVTSKGDTVDFVSRFFAPQLGVNEDPVTGSAHTSLTPFWSERLGKNKLIANQLSKRGGQLACEFKNDRCRIGGKARLYLTGEINLD